jgi:hypothetical protein
VNVAYDSGRKQLVPGFTNRKDVAALQTVIGMRGGLCTRYASQQLSADNSVVCAYHALDLPQHVQWSPRFWHELGIARQFRWQGA